MAEKTGPSRREVIALVVVFLALFTVFNYITFFGNRWFLHPDDKNVYVFSNVLLETGHLWHQSAYNQEFDNNAFVPGLNEYESDAAQGHRIQAPYSPGIFFVLAPFNWFGLRGPFVAVSLLGIMGLIFFYLMLRKLYGPKVAFIALLLLGFTSAYVYWSNMLFTNIPALAFFLGGAYFLVMVREEPERLRYYLLAVAFFSIGVWIRYEFAIFAVLAMILPLSGWRKLKWRYVAYAFLLLAGMAIAVILLNHATTGAFFGVPQKAGATASEYVVKYPARFKGFGVIANNGDMYVLSIAPLLTVLGAVGLIWVLRNERRAQALFLAALGLLVFYYYGNNNKFWGYDKYWFASSYTRYFLPLFVALAFFAALLMVRFFGGLGWKHRLTTLFLGFLVLTHIVTSFFILNNSTYGLSYTNTYLESRKAVDDFASSLPDQCVVVDLSSGWYEKMIISRTVFIPTKLGKDSRLEETREVLERLLGSGIGVYVFDNPERNVMTLEDISSLNADFTLTPVLHEINFAVGGRKPDVYELQLGGEK